jgi:hypothetical protein
MAIELKEAIDTIESGDWFSIRFITADVLKGSGGKVIELAKARVARNRSEKLKTQNPKLKTLAFRRTRTTIFTSHATLNCPTSKFEKCIHPLLLT